MTCSRATPYRQLLQRTLDDDRLFHQSLLVRLGRYRSTARSEITRIPTLIPDDLNPYAFLLAEVLVPFVRLSVGEDCLRRREDFLSWWQVSSSETRAIWKGWGTYDFVL